MLRPPIDPRYRPIHDRPTWRTVLASYALAAALLLALWAASNPLAAGVVLATTAGLAVGARRAVRLTEYCRECRAFTLDLGGRVRLTVAETRIEEAN